MVLFVLNEAIDIYQSLSGRHSDLIGDILTSLETSKNKFRASGQKPQKRL